MDKTVPHILQKKNWIALRIVSVIGVIWSFFLGAISLPGAWLYATAILGVVLMFITFQDWTTPPQRQQWATARSLVYIVAIGMLTHGAWYAWHLAQVNGIGWFLSIGFLGIIWTLDLAIQDEEYPLLEVFFSWLGAIVLVALVAYLYPFSKYSLALLGVPLIFAFFTNLKTYLLEIGTIGNILFCTAVLIFGFMVLPIPPLISGLIIGWWWNTAIIASSRPEIPLLWRVIIGSVITIILLITNPWL